MKFAIFFCVVAIACVAQAQWFSLPSNSMIDSVKDKLEEAKEKATELTTQASELLQKTVDEAKEKAQSLTEQLKESGEKLKESVTESVNKIVKGANEEIAEVEQQAIEQGVKNVTECTGIAKRIAEAAKELIVNVVKCVTDKVQAGTKLAGEIKTKSTTAVSDLFNLKKQIEQCDQGTGVLARVSTLSCFTTNGAKASWVVATQIPSLAFDLKEMTDLISSLQDSLQECIQSNIDDFKEEIKAIVATIKECLGEKINSIKSE